MLTQFRYIKTPQKTNIKSMVEFLLCENGKAETFAHVCTVAQENVKIAKAFNLNEEKCYLAGLLHDVSVIIEPCDILSFAKKSGWNLCEAEEKFPSLLHQRLSVKVARHFFGISDNELLSPIACHTTLKASPNAYETALFVADKLSWCDDGVPDFYDEVKLALDIFLEKASYVYMKFMTENGRVLFPHEDWIKAILRLEEYK